uniref:Coat protein n=1 Tax=Strawberry pallidosis-associated virus TaxID=227507 RepID=A0A2U8U8I3_9CLOS|nr:coat protein [Strawberry pallidosis-associated virus]
MAETTGDAPVTNAETTPPRDQEVRNRSNDEFDEGFFSRAFNSVSKRDDVANDSHSDPNTFSDIKVTADRGDTLNEEQNKKYEVKLKEYCQTITKVDVDEKTFLAFYCSLIKMAKNQSTSIRNNNNPHLTNSFSVADKTFSYKTKDFLTFMAPHFTGVNNPLRRYMRKNEGRIKTISAAAGIDSDGHLAAKHGTTSQFWGATSDFTNGCETNISDDDLAANYMQREAATKNKARSRTIFNVSQLAGNVQ